MFITRQRGTQFLASLLSFALVATSSHAMEAVQALSTSTLERFAPPPSLGSLAEVYQGSDPRTVVLIQDLHINYGVQKNIRDILSYYSSRKTLPPFIAVEGAQGTVDASILANFPDEDVRRETADYFMRKGELSGADAFAAEQGLPQALYGIEKSDYYEFHKALFQKSLAARQDFEQELACVARPLALLKKREYTRAMRKLDRANDDGQNLETLRLLAETPLQKNLVEADQTVHLLTRLLKQQALEAEVRDVAIHLDRHLQALVGVLNLDDSALERVAQAVKASIEFYVLASMREKPIFENTLSRMDALKTPVGVLVIGGFHTAGLKAQLRARRLSYAIVMPRVNEIRPEDEKLYEDRLMDKHVTIEEALSDQAAESPAGISQTLSPGHALLQNPALRPVVQAVLAARLYHKTAERHPDWTPSTIAQVVARSIAIHYALPAQDRIALEQRVQAYSVGFRESPKQEIEHFLTLNPVKIFRFIIKHGWNPFGILARAVGYVYISSYATLKTLAAQAAGTWLSRGSLGTIVSWGQAYLHFNMEAHKKWNKGPGTLALVRLTLPPVTSLEMAYSKIPGAIQFRYKQRIVIVHPNPIAAQVGGRPAELWIYRFAGEGWLYVAAYEPASQLWHTPNPQVGLQGDRLTIDELNRHLHNLRYLRVVGDSDNQIIDTRQDYAPPAPESRKAMIVPVFDLNGRRLETKTKAPSVRIELTAADIDRFDGKADNNPFDGGKGKLWDDFRLAMKLSGLSLREALRRNHLDTIAVERGTNNLAGETVFDVENKIATLRVQKRLGGLGAILAFIAEATWLKLGRKASQARVTAEALQTFIWNLPYFIGLDDSVEETFFATIESLDMGFSSGMGHMMAGLLRKLPRSDIFGQVPVDALFQAKRRFFQFNLNSLVRLIEDQVLPALKKRHPKLLENEDGSSRYAMPVPSSEVAPAATGRTLIIDIDSFMIDNLWPAAALRELKRQGLRLIAVSATQKKLTAENLIRLSGLKGIFEVVLGVEPETGSEKPPLSQEEKFNGMFKTLETDYHIDLGSSLFMISEGRKGVLPQKVAGVVEFKGARDFNAPVLNYLTPGMPTPGEFNPPKLTAISDALRRIVNSNYLPIFPFRYAGHDEPAVEGSAPRDTIVDALAELEAGKSDPVRLNLALANIQHVLQDRNIAGDLYRQIDEQWLELYSLIHAPTPAPPGTWSVPVAVPQAAMRSLEMDRFSHEKVILSGRSPLTGRALADALRNLLPEEDHAIRFTTLVNGHPVEHDAPITDTSDLSMVVDMQHGAADGPSSMASGPKTAILDWRLNQEPDFVEAVRRLSMAGAKVLIAGSRADQEAINSWWREDDNRFPVASFAVAGDGRARKPEDYAKATANLLAQILDERDMNPGAILIVTGAVEVQKIGESRHVRTIALNQLDTAIPRGTAAVSGMTTDQSRDEVRRFVTEKLGFKDAPAWLLEILSRFWAVVGEARQMITDPMGWMNAKGHHPWVAGLGLLLTILMMAGTAHFAPGYFAHYSPGIQFSLSSAAVVTAFFGTHLAFNIATLILWGLRSIAREINDWAIARQAAKAAEAAEVNNLAARLSDLGSRIPMQRVLLGASAFLITLAISFHIAPGDRGMQANAARFGAAFLTAA